MNDTANLCERLRDRAAFCKDCGGVTTYDEGDSALDNEAADLIERLDAMLAASPVVPVGVREEVEIIEDWLAMARSCQPVGGIVWHVPMCQTEIDAIAAILAALRPTDTGRQA